MIDGKELGTGMNYTLKVRQSSMQTLRGRAYRIPTLIQTLGIGLGDFHAACQLSNSMLAIVLLAWASGSPGMM